MLLFCFSDEHKSLCPAGSGFVPNPDTLLPEGKYSQTPLNQTPFGPDKMFCYNHSKQI